MTEHPANPNDMANDPSLIVARYVEGLLEGEELARFARDLATSPALRAELEAMQRIDASLKGAFGSRPTPASIVIHPRHKTWHLVAAAAMILIGVALVGLFLWPRTPAEFNARDLYTGFIDSGYQPKWVCADDAEFITYTREHLGQAIRPTPPPTIELVGWAYAEELKGLGFDKYAVVLLARVDGKEVLGVFDPTNTGRLPEDPRGALNIYAQTLGPVPLFEVTPLDTPHLHESMQIIPGDTMDIRTGPANNAPPN